MKLRKSLVAVGVVGALVLSGCAGGDDGGGSAPEEGAALTIAMPQGPITTQTSNPLVGDSLASLLGYGWAVYEPLGIVNLIDPTAEVRPWLAQEITWSEDYTSVQLTAREGATWSDGEEFTADDIAFTFNLIRENPGLDSSALGVVEATSDGTTATVTFGSSMFIKQDKVLHKPIVPEHIWADVADPLTFANENPVGTGPYTMSNFSTQAVEFTARDDYWGGELAVPTLYYVSYADNTALTTALATGEADWAQAAIANAQSAYVDQDPDNVYWAPGALSVDTMFVNTTTKPFNDVAFRQAVNRVIDRAQYAQIAREGGVDPLTSVTGLPSPAGDAFISGDLANEQYAVDVEGARAILEEAGYTWSGDTLVDPDGEEVTFALSVPQGWNDYVTGISLISDSVAALGVTAQVDTPSVDAWWGAKGIGEFQAILHWTETGSTPYDIYSDMMDGRFLKPMGENADFNFGRYDNPEATELLNEYATTTDDAARDAAMARIQEIFVEEVPGMPVATRPLISEYNTRNYVGWPSEEDPYAPADPTQPSAVLVLTELEPAE